jgi:hypothetical protein
MISRCLTTHGQRIAMLPISEWKEEVQKLPERCEHDDCSTGNCREICQVWLRGQFMAKRSLARIEEAKRRGGGR